MEFENEGREHFYFQRKLLFGVFVTLTCIKYDAFVCLNVFVTLTPMGFLLFFALLTKSTNHLGLNVATIRMNCLFFYVFVL